MDKGKKVLVGAAGVARLAKQLESARSGAAGDEGIEVEIERARLVASLPLVLQNLGAEGAQRGGVMTAPEHEMTAVVQSVLAEHAEDTGALEQIAADTYEVKYDEGDIGGWLFRFLPAYLAGRFKKRAFRTPSEEPVTIPANARVAIFGDWGSGLYGAPGVAQSVAEVRPGFDVVMHLGDVYYAGTTREVRENMLNLWPDVPGAVHRALNSNHEMYSGGEGYFDQTLNDPRFAGQRASCFALQNDRFLLLGLDTGYDDHDLTDAQEAWVRRRVANAAGRKVILFSHHQLYSAFEGDGPKLAARHRDLLDARAVFAWYWAHEHRCVLFDAHPRWGLHGRCVGHGGYPAFRDKHTGPVRKANLDGSSWREVQAADKPLALALDGPNPYVAGEAERYAPNGFMTLNFDGGRLHELVHAVDGAVILSRDIG